MNHLRRVEGEIEEWSEGRFCLQIVDLVPGVIVQLYAGDDRGWVPGFIGSDREGRFFIDVGGEARIRLQAGMPMWTEVAIH